MPPIVQRSVELDHLVVACSTLDQGDAWLQRCTGARSSAGGSHPGWGTHNRLLRLDARTYLELIALDPGAREPSSRPPFGLDDPALQERLALRPRLLHYVCRVPLLDDDRARSHGYDPGPVIAMTRGALSWRITMPTDARLASARWTDAGRLQPTLIEWAGGRTPERHPVDALDASGVLLLAIRIAAPAGLALPAALRDDRRFVIGAATVPALGAELSTPKGWRLLD